MKINILITFILFATCSAYAQIPTDGLVGYWPFNGNVNDESGNGYYGIVNGAQLANDRFGNQNSAYRFDGIDDYIQISNTLGFQQWTISVWIKPDVPIPSEPPFYGLMTVLMGDTRTELLGITNSALRLYTTSITNYSFNQNGGWHHVVYAYDGKNLTGYVDLDSTSTIEVINPFDRGISRRIGSRGDNTHSFKGVIDDVSIYNRKLSAGEIQALYSGEPFSLHQICTQIYCNGEKVGIGTDNPDSKLTVNGTIHTKEVKVDLNGFTAPDFVFEEGYNLSTLEETAQYIQSNKHLPDIPSASEMEADGVNLKELNLKLLQKIEELTLHLIEQHQTNKEQNRHLLKQDRTIEELQNQIKDLQSLKTE